MPKLLNCIVALIVSLNVVVNPSFAQARTRRTPAIQSSFDSFAEQALACSLVDGVREILASSKPRVHAFGTLIPQVVLDNPGHIADDLVVGHASGDPRPTVLVTGGAGFMGAHFVHYLLQAHPGYRVIVLDNLAYSGHRGNLADIEKSAGPALRARFEFIEGDILNPRTVRAALSRADAVVHFAAQVSVDRALRDESVFEKTNARGTRTLLEALRWENEKRAGQRRARVKMLHISTDEVYGGAETDHHPGFVEDSPFNPQNPYARSKVAAEKWVRFYNMRYGLGIQILRSANNVGIFKYPEAFFPLALLHRLLDLKIPIFNEGAALRDWLSAWDMARAVDAVMHRGGSGEIYNVARDGIAQKKNRVAVQTLLAVLGESDDPKFLSNIISYVSNGRETFEKWYPVNDQRLRLELGWEPVVPLSVVLGAMISWHAANVGRLVEILTSPTFVRCAERILSRAPDHWKALEAATESVRRDSDAFRRRTRAYARQYEARRARRGQSAWAVRAFAGLAFLIGMAILCPTIWLLSRATASRGPLFFVQDRVGFEGKTLRLRKFRTMTLEQDPRLRRVIPGGRFLRLLHLDEWPQLKAVWDGDMVIVGPRPDLKKRKGSPQVPAQAGIEQDYIDRVLTTTAPGFISRNTVRRVILKEWGVLQQDKTVRIAFDLADSARFSALEMLRVLFLAAAVFAAQLWKRVPRVGSQAPLRRLLNPLGTHPRGYLFPKALALTKAA